MGGENVRPKSKPLIFGCKLTNLLSHRWKSRSCILTCDYVKQRPDSHSQSSLFTTWRGKNIFSACHHNACQETPQKKVVTTEKLHGKDIFLIFKGYSFNRLSINHHKISYPQAWPEQSWPVKVNLVSVLSCM